MSEQFGRYTVLNQLGKGAMGVVFLASDPVLNRQVAVKTVDLAVEDAKEREFLRDRLFRDARAAAVLKHPNIVAIYDVFEEGDRAYVVMEYVEGESLAARLKSKPLPDATLVLGVLRQMADALDYTHAHGVIHRDIKPGNVMLDAAGTAKIMDFGIARIADTRTVTPTGMVMGTVEYMAPEQILGEPVDGRADQFALAVVAYQMMTGSTLFGPSGIATLTYKIVNETAPLARTRNAALPAGVDDVLSRALAKKPGERFESCAEFVNALSQAYAEAPTSPLAPAAIATSATTVTMVQPPRGSRVGIWAACAVVVLGAAGVVVWKQRSQPQPATTAAVAVPAAPPVTEPAAAPPAPPAAPAAKAPAKSEKAVAEVAPSKPPATKAAPPPVEIPEPPAEPDPTPPEATAAKTPHATAFRRAMEQEKENDYLGAIQSLSRAISLHPDFAQAYFARGSARAHLDQVQDAILDYTAALKLAPKMVGAYAGRGNCLVRLHRDPEALIDFQRALEINPNYVPALAGRGNVAFHRKQYKLALDDFNKALSINPRYGPGYSLRARLRDETGDAKGAAADRAVEASLRKP